MHHTHTQDRALLHCCVIVMSDCYNAESDRRIASRCYHRRVGQPGCRDGRYHDDQTSRLRRAGREDCRLEPSQRNQESIHRYTVMMMISSARYTMAVIARYTVWIHRSPEAQLLWVGSLSVLTTIFQVNGLAGVYWSKGQWKWWWQLELQSNHHQQTNVVSPLKTFISLYRLTAYHTTK